MKVVELESRDVQVLKNVIYDSFKKMNLEKVLSKIVFLASNGASVNNGMKSGLIFLLKEGYKWISFIWCCLQLLELGYSFNQFIKPLGQPLIYSCYIYKKIKRKMRELK